jgi:hypothetical protein
LAGATAVTRVIAGTRESAYGVGLRRTGDQPRDPLMRALLDGPLKPELAPLTDAQRRRGMTQADRANKQQNEITSDVQVFAGSLITGAQVGGVPHHTVRGHAKVATGGRERVPAGGHVKGPALV